jgi:transcription-repair coupling factor (superfamily II helicase)
LYTQLDQIETEEDLLVFAEMLQDRFGKVPPSVLELFDGLRVRWICKELGVDRFVLKESQLRAFFVYNPRSPFYDSPMFKAILEAVNKTASELGLSVKESRQRLMLICKPVADLVNAQKILHRLLETCREILDADPSLKVSQDN